MKKIVFSLVLLMVMLTARSQDIQKIKIEALMTMIDTSSTPMVVNFWASWCSPCIKEIPWFEKTVAEHKDKGVKLVLVSLDFANDYKKKVLHQFVKKNKYSSQVVWLDETDADRFCPPIDSSWGGAIPATLMVNNKKGYKQFFEFQLKEERFKLELAKLVE